jgi:hypothetical protein
MSRFSLRLHDFWFRPVPPDALGICRIVIFAFAAIWFAYQPTASWARVDPVFWAPIALFMKVRLPVLSEPQLGALHVAWRLALVLSAIGFMTGWSTVAAFALTLYLAGLPQNFSKIHHYDALLTLAIGVMALSRCGDAWSLDALFRRARLRAVPSQSGEYRWPIALVTCLLSLCYFAAGYSKLSVSGMRWALSDNLATLLVTHARLPVPNAPPLFPGVALAIAGSPIAARGLALGALLIECLYPLALVSVAARGVLVPGAILMNLGIQALMGPTFLPLIVCNVFWIPWNIVSVRRGAPGWFGGGGIPTAQDEPE